MLYKIDFRLAVYGTIGIRDNGRVSDVLNGSVGL